VEECVALGAGHTRRVPDMLVGEGGGELRGSNLNHTPNTYTGPRCKWECQPGVITCHAFAHQSVAAVAESRSCQKVGIRRIGSTIAERAFVF
jgi:hypothetical protein